MEIIFVENTDPFQNFVGGIPTYLRNVSKYLKSKSDKTIFIGSIINMNDEQLKSKAYFDETYNISSCKIGHTKFLLKLFMNFNKLNINTDGIIHSQRLLLCLPFIFKFKNIICTSHGIDFETVSARRGKIYGFIYKVIERLVVPRLKFLIVVDPRAENYYRINYPKMQGKIKRIPIGIEDTSFYPIVKERCHNVYDLDLKMQNILFLGRIEYQKNLKLLLDAQKIINEKSNSVSLIIAGEGNLKNTYEEYCLKKNVCNVRFIGSVPRNQIIQLLNLCDLMVLSSHFEGSPTVVKEAIACNLPIVSTDCGDVSEVIKGLDKCYIALSNPEDLANKIHMSLSNKKIIDYSHRSELYFNEKQFHILKSIYHNITYNKSSHSNN